MIVGPGWKRLFGPTPGIPGGNLGILSKMEKKSDDMNYHSFEFGLFFISFFGEHFATNAKTLETFGYAFRKGSKSFNRWECFHALSQILMFILNIKPFGASMKII